ncbi:hypothetical protein HOLleu_14880 [Holothuria leucospilota]|uniref:EGF-like domain-containing protein n=1 Tax=Holothuria leucospilota TaxID=206669 RepID=A0A9Q1C8Y8_HOLLE|nr:hypothetical protein HOLleu_14880 [Holothuria leucospilota]
MKPFHFCVLFVGVCLCFLRKFGVHASCNPNPCMNGGVCHTLPNTTAEFCLCPHNYTGSQFCHPSNIQATTMKLDSSATSPHSRTHTLHVQEVSTRSSQHVITESGGNDGVTSTLKPTTNVRQRSTSSAGSTTDDETATAAASRRVARTSTTVEDKVLQRSSTQSTPGSDVASFTRSRTMTVSTKVQPNVAPTKEAETLIPTKSTKKQGRNYSLWFTWIVILLFVTSVLLLILAIALFISYGRVGSYNQDDERDSQDYPPEEDDLDGRKQVFTLKFT